MSSLPAASAEAAPAAVPSVEPPPVAATWQERAVEAPWLPAELAPHVGDALAWLADVAYEDARAEAHDAAGWRLVAATRRGRVHAHAGDHREDAYAVAQAGDAVIAVLSDGAGSARWSRVGAEVTCRETARAAAAALGGESRSPEALGAALTGGVRSACEMLRSLAERAAVPAKEFRCTALAVALDPALGVLAAVQVGDGAVAVRAPEGTVRVLGTADAGDYSGEVSCFVPDACADERAAAAVHVPLAEVVDVLVATDGVEDAVYPLARTGAAVLAQLRDGVNGDLLDGFQRQPAHGPVLGDGVTADDAAERLARWLTFEKRGENDDRTAVVLSRRGA